MHIPDGFLSTPVWAALDVAAVPAAGYVVRRAQREFEDRKVPLLGVMGAFLFAAQTINFPVGPGTSGHLVGGALLACTLGPAAASVVMIAILTIQSLIFQDGGILALGANIFNMALMGVAAGYLPYHLWGNGKNRSASIFLGGFFSVLVAVLQALAALNPKFVNQPKSGRGIALGSVALAAVLLAVVGVLFASTHPDGL